MVDLGGGGLFDYYFHSWCRRDQCHERGQGEKTVELELHDEGNGWIIEVILFAKKEMRLALPCLGERIEGWMVWFDLRTGRVLEIMC